MAPSRARRVGLIRLLLIAFTALGLVVDAAPAVWPCFLLCDSSDECPFDFSQDDDDDGDDEATPGLENLRRLWPKAKMAARPVGHRQRIRSLSIPGAFLIVSEDVALYVARPDAWQGAGRPLAPTGLPVLLCRLTC